MQKEKSYGVGPHMGQDTEKEKQIRFACDVETYTRLAEFCDKTGRKRYSVWRDAVNKYIDIHEAAKKSKDKTMLEWLGT